MKFLKAVAPNLLGYLFKCYIYHCKIFKEYVTNLEFLYNKKIANAYLENVNIFSSSYLLLSDDVSSFLCQNCEENKHVISK